MKNKLIGKVAILIVVTLMVQSVSSMGTASFSVKASVGKTAKITMDNNVTGESMTEEPITKGPATEEPITKGTDTEESTIQEPVTEEPTTREPVTEEPTTREPVTEEPTTQEPATEEPTTPDYEIVDGVYKVKEGVLIEYLGDKKDKNTTLIKIPAQVQTIGENVFENCKYIEEIKFASDSKLTEIKKYAFKNCKALKKISLPSGLKTIRYRAFDKCTSLEKVKIPGMVTKAYQIFGTKNSVKEVTFGSQMTVIPNQILQYAYSVESVNFQGKLVQIGKKAFYSCTSLKKITLPKTVKIISESAFYNCSSMTKFTMSTAINSIGKCAFEKCEKLTSLTLYKTITSIGEGAFQGDDALTLKVYANSKGKAYARINKIKWDYTNSEKKRRAANQKIYDSYINKIDDSDKNKYKLKYLSDYVPQGNCIIGDYLVVSMYHKYLSKRSVLVLYKKDTGTFIKTLILPYKDHVGAVSNVKGRLVVTYNNISATDYVGVFNYKRIKKAKHGKVIKQNYMIKLPGYADFATYDGTYYWAGRSGNINYATMQGYKVSVKKKKLVFKSKYSYYVPANTQGLIIKKISKTKIKFIFSQSYGRLNNSKMLSYTKNLSKAGGLGNVTEELVVPCMLEGMCLTAGGYVYMVFESSAKLYCGNPDNTSEIQIRNVCRIKYSLLGL